MIIIPKCLEVCGNITKDDPYDNKTRSGLFRYKIKITEKSPADGSTKDVKIAVPLK